MRKKTLVVVSFLFYIVLHSQERTNKPIPKIGTQVEGQLIKATGWLLDPQGQWISGLNKIPGYDKTNNVDEFISYQFREVKILDSTYSILIKKCFIETLKTGIAQYGIEFYVFSKTQLAQLNDIKNDTINLIKITVLYSGFSGGTKDTYISEIQKEIAHQIQSKNDTSETDKELIREGAQIDFQANLIFHIAPYKSKNIVQFQIYSYKDLGDGYNQIEGVSAIAVTEDMQGDKFFLTNDLFKHCYFETDYQTFNSFIRISNSDTK